MRGGKEKKRTYEEPGHYMVWVFIEYSNNVLLAWGPCFMQLRLAKVYHGLWIGTQLIFSKDT